MTLIEIMRRPAERRFDQWMREEIDRIRQMREARWNTCQHGRVDRSVCPHCMAVASMPLAYEWRGYGA